MAAYQIGKGSDGALSLSTSRIEDTEQGVENITSQASSGQADVIVNSGATFSAGEWVLVIQSRGTGAGNYEQAKISSISSNTLTLSSNLTNTYQSTGAQVVKMAQYSSVTINSGGAWTASAWNGTKGGVLAAMVSGNLTVSTGGSISVNGKGYVGGVAQSSRDETGNTGEGTDGASQLKTLTANGNGGGGGVKHDPGIQNPTGGAGGGHSAAGDSKTSGVHTSVGGEISGNAELTTLTFGGSGGSGGSKTTGSGGGGLGGGIIILIVGGDITIGAAVSSNGGNGTDAPLPNDDSRGGAGGGGAGGSIRFICEGTVALGTGNVTASAGAGGTSFNAPRNGGNGSVGRIATLSSATVTGTSTPTIDETSTDTTIASTDYLKELSEQINFSETSLKTHDATRELNESMSYSESSIKRFPPKTFWRLKL